MKIVLISDTHGMHNSLGKLPKGDMIIHAGDVTNIGKEYQVMEFLSWFAGLKYKYKIFIAGNHDFYFERTPDEIVRENLPDGVTYLNDSGVEICGLKIWGSPITPTFFAWAFMRNRGASIAKHWGMIPDGSDIVVTHGPVYGIHDECHDEHVGCNELAKRITEVKPRYHIGGHIHEGYGVFEKEGTTYVNPSVLDGDYKMVNKPIVIDVKTN